MIRGHRPPMADTIQRCEGGVDNSSAGSPSSVSDETDPAGVVLEPRVVQARVPQFEVPTLSPVAAPHHGRFNQKNGAWSYLRYKSATGATAEFAGQGGRSARSDPPSPKAERRYRQPLCAGIHIAAPFAALELGEARGEPLAEGNASRPALGCQTFVLPQSHEPPLM